MKRILIVEDDEDINNLLKKILEKTNYLITQTFSGTEADLQINIATPDLILLDLMLPGKNGEDLILDIRNKNVDIPIIVISAKTSLESKVTAIKTGADDYITKPFEPEEVLVRVQAVLRRYNNHESIKQGEAYTYKNIALNNSSRSVTVCDIEISLTRFEYEILHLLIQQPNKVYSRESLYETVWKNGYYGEDNTVNVHISNIRKKINEIDPSEEYIKTVWGIGFKMA